MSNDAISYFRTAESLNTSTTSAAIRNYGGGGYVFKLTGYMDSLNESLQMLKAEPWSEFHQLLFMTTVSKS